MSTQHDDPDRVPRAVWAPTPKARAVDAGVLVGGAGPRPVDLLRPGGVLQLQRSAGNAAVARRLGGQRSRVAVQRSKESEELLTKLATPKVGEGQATGVQTELVDTLEQLINQKTWSYDVVPGDLTIGGVLIDRLPNADKTYMPSEDKQQRKGDIQGLFQQLVFFGGDLPAAVFVNLDMVKDDKAAKLGAKFGAEVKQAGLGPKVVENTLKTMLDAGQFEYLRLAGLPNKDWKILVEVHYIRARPKDMAGFHKDTQGQSIFVNLNYHVPGYRLRGPEYVLNPPTSEAHDKQIYGTPGKKGTLPEEFTKDLTKTREALGEPTRIASAGTVEELGYVAFVDEAVHHATPWFGGRYVTPSEFEAFLKRKYPAQLDEIEFADGKYRYLNSKLWKKPFKEYVDEKIIGRQDVKKWRKWLAMISVSETETSAYNRETKYTRLDFAGTMQGNEFDLMLEDVGSHVDSDRRSGGAAGWYEASIPEAGFSPIKPKGKPPLVRTASERESTKHWPKQLPEEVPRKFIRSWVRAVPKTFADSLRGS